jgi:hypothetical protein
MRALTLSCFIINVVLSALGSLGISSFPTLSDRTLVPSGSSPLRSASHPRIHNDIEIYIRDIMVVAGIDPGTP